MTFSQRMKNKNQNGMSLLELMVVTAIASALIMVSVPLYQNYTTRTKIGSELPLSRPLMLLMNEQYATNSVWPSSNDEANAHPPTSYSGEYLLSAAISDTPQDGTMTLTYDTSKIPVLRGSDTIVFYPVQDINGAVWHCDQGTIPAKYRPSRCKN